VLKNYPEFLSKFEKVDLAETNFEETVAVLLNYAKINKIKIKEEALLEIVRLADRLIGNQPEPAKSLAVLEELQALGKTITIEDVRQVVSDKTNIPIGEIGGDERKVLIELEASMKKKIIGQDEAVKDVARRSGACVPASRITVSPREAFFSWVRQGSGKRIRRKFWRKAISGGLTR